MVLNALQFTYDSDKKKSLHKYLFEYDCPEGKWEGKYMKWNDRRPTPSINLDSVMAYIYGEDVSPGFLSVCQCAED